MNAKALLSMVLALSFVGAGAFGIVLMDSDDSSGAHFGTTMNVGETYEKSFFAPQLAALDGNYPVGTVLTNGGTENGVMYYFTLTVTPTTAGIYDFTVGVPGNVNTFSITVIGMFFDDPPAFNMLVGDSLNYQASTNLPSSFVKESGADWVTISFNGLVSGTAPSSGTHTFTIRATTTNAPVQTALQTVSFEVHDVLVITSTYGKDIIATEEFRYVPTANYGNAVITVSGLPAGAVFVDGMVRWVPVNDGDYQFTVTSVSNEGVNQTATETVSLTVHPKLYFTSVPTADMVVIPNGSAIQFYSMSTGATSVLWEFSDGQTSDEWYPELTFDSGTVTAKLTAFNELGSDTAETTFSVVSETKDGMSFIDFLTDNAVAILVILMLALIVAGAKLVRRRG